MPVNRRSITNILRIWRFVRAFTGDELRRLQDEAVSFAIAGPAACRVALKARMAIGESQAAEYETMGEAVGAGDTLVLDSESAAIQSDAGLKSALDGLARRRPSLRVALASKYPVFRPIVAEQLTREVSQTNAKIAALSALPGIVPFTDWLMPATAAGDLIVLTRNQINLLLEISACYGMSPDPRARLTELIPVIGGAFGWRAIARQLVGLAPAGIGVGVKAAVAYVGTYAVGRAANTYYAGGKTVDMQKIVRDILREGAARSKGLLRLPERLPVQIRRLGKRSA
jgi:uncharacterized protein (DUF697 family)